MQNPFKLQPPSPPQQPCLFFWVLEEGMVWERRVIVDLWCFPFVMDLIKMDYD